MLSNIEKEATSLPPPSALFGTNYYYPPGQTNAVEARSGYMLPPPSSLPGYHLPPPPQYMYHPHPQPQPNTNMYYYQQPTQHPPQSNTKPLSNPTTTTDTAATEKVKRKRRTPAIDPTIKKNKKATPPYHYEVLELKQNAKKSGKKTSRKESEAVSAAAATLASFASCSPHGSEEEDLDECMNLEACAGQGGQFECELCGCNYRHLNCLQKHGWEHTEVRLNMTKHQQNQLIEAAQILMDIARYGMKMRMLQ